MVLETRLGAYVVYAVLHGILLALVMGARCSRLTVTSTE